MGLLLAVVALGIAFSAARAPWPLRAPESEPQGAAETLVVSPAGCGLACASSPLESRSEY